MPYSFQPDAMYRMPTHFGPRTGPRRGPDGRGFDCVNSPKSRSHTVSYLTHASALEALLPPGFALHGEPVVTVSATYMKEIDWLAGRGYNTLGASIPVTFTGRTDRATGSLLLVLWENLTDPILTGREELGFSKIYCELPEPNVYNDATHCVGSWLGFRFLDLRLSGMAELSAEEIAAQAANVSSDGTLHYKYMPRTGDWGKADAEYAVLTPAHTPNRRVLGMWRGEGTVQWQRASWEEMPTQLQHRQRAGRSGDYRVSGRGHYADDWRQGPERSAHSEVIGAGILPIFHSTTSSSSRQRRGDSLFSKGYTMLVITIPLQRAGRLFGAVTADQTTQNQ